MASPYLYGNGTGLPFVGTHVRILRESLGLTLSPDYRSCTFEATYHVASDSSGLRIPLIFVAYGYDDSMEIWVDGKPVPVLDLPEQYFKVFRECTPPTRFQMPGGDSLEEVNLYEIEWEKGNPQSYSREDLHYFEADLAVGEHAIRVRYRARAWIDRSGWMGTYWHRYALDPAAHWSDFGALEVRLDARLTPAKITTNLGAPDSGAVEQVAVWHFDSLPPVKTLEVELRPIAPPFGEAMMAFGMPGFLWSSAILLALLHGFLMWRWRRRRPRAKFNWVWLLGALVVPFAAMLVYCLSYLWINAAIGPAASRFGGYYFLIFLFYPVAAPIYGLLMLALGYLFKRRAHATTVK